jgi:hypothetical protein
MVRQLCKQNGEYITTCIMQWSQNFDYIGLYYFGNWFYWKIHYPDFYGFRILYEEIDYINEGKNADRFRRDFRNIKWVRVPVCFLDLTMQFIFGFWFSAPLRLFPSPDPTRVGASGTGSALFLFSAPPLLY